VQSPIIISGLGFHRNLINMSLQHTHPRQNFTKMCSQLFEYRTPADRQTLRQRY